MNDEDKEETDPDDFNRKQSCKTSDRELEHIINTLNETKEAKDSFLLTSSTSNSRTKHTSGGCSSV
eukprot:Pgem_evm1s6888